MTTLPVNFTLTIPSVTPRFKGSVEKIGSSLELEYSQPQSMETWRYRNAFGTWIYIDSSIALDCSANAGNDAVINIYIKNASESEQGFLVWRTLETSSQVSAFFIDISPRSVGCVELRVQSPSSDETEVWWHVQARQDPVLKIRYQFSGKPKDERCP